MVMMQGFVLLLPAFSKAGEQTADYEGCEDRS